MKQEDLQTHRHDEIKRIVLVGLMKHATRIGVLKLCFDLLAAQGFKRIHQIGDVEADLDRVAAVVDVELVDGLFLLGSLVDAVRGTEPAR